MSIWISRRGAAALIAVLFLTACAETPAVNTRDFGFARKAPQTVAVANRSVVIGGPPGYCVDKAASRLRGDTAFVLLGSCASITQDPNAAAPGIPGILTASVAEETGGGPATDAALGQLQRFIETPAGRGTLARDGSAESVDILDARRESGAIFIYLRDTSAGAIPGMDDAYWRGLFNLNGRLVTVSVVSFADRPLTADAGLQTLRAFLSRIRAETPQQNADSVASAPRRGFLQTLLQ